MAELQRTLEATDGVRVRAGESLARHVPLRVGGEAALWAEVRDPQALRQTLKSAQKHNVHWRVHWPFTDWLVREAGLEMLVVRPGQGFEYVLRVPATEAGAGAVRVGAACPWANLAGLDEPGLSGPASWPGTPGGLFAQGEQDCLRGFCVGLRVLHARGVTSLTVLPGETAPELPGKGVLLDVDLRPATLSLPRRPTGPGKLFADPGVPGADGTAAGVLVRSGLLGSRLRHWRLSATEPGTLVHLGGGSCEDVLLLAKGVQARVEKTRGVKLDTRIPVLGNQPNRRRRR